MNKIIFKFFVFLFCFTLCFGCSCDSKSNLIVYKNFYDIDVTTFNYILTNDYDNMSRIANLIDGLVENDKYGNIVPSIAKSWSSEVIEGKQIWTFHLKDDVYWSDYKGHKYSKVTANDFVTTLKYSLNFNTDSSNYALPASLIENGYNYYNGTMIKNFDYNFVLNKIDSLKSSRSNNELSFYLKLKEAFDVCNQTNKCTDNFNDVGIKALDKFTLQFTLTKPIPYFLSALTYFSFLPTNENYLIEVGINNFGTNKKNLLYNGAYILDNHSHSSRMEFIKNPNYWDKSNVFIDKLIFIKSFNYNSPNYSRLNYEAGNIDEFVVSKEDTKGWQKYVLGEDGTGNNLSPNGDNTYVSADSNNFTVYYLIFNQQRKYINSTLTTDEIDISNRALSNTNFRKALFHGINKNFYFSNEQNPIVNSIVPKGFASDGSKDYNDYFIEFYSQNNNLSIDQASILFDNSPFFDKDLSSHYLSLALDELNLDSSQLPIKLEYTFYYDDTYINYDLDRIKKWNYDLNGCDSENCSFDKIEITYNFNIDSLSEMDLALENGQYSLTFLGLYPDFNDPTTYLNAFGKNGEFSKYLNNTSTHHIDNLLAQIDNYYLHSNLKQRYSLCSKLENYILFEESLVLPLSLKGTSSKVIVSNLVPFQKMKASYGLSPFKFKFRKIRTKSYSQADIALLKKEYQEGYQND